MKLIRNLRAGIRLATTGRGVASDFAFSIDQAVLLTIAVCALSALGSFVGSVPPRDFYFPAIEGLSFRLVLTLGFAYLATRFFSLATDAVSVAKEAVAKEAVTKEAVVTRALATGSVAGGGATEDGAGRRVVAKGDLTPLMVVLLSLAAVEQVIVSILDRLEIHLPILAEEPYVTAIGLAVWAWLFWVTFSAVRLVSLLPRTRAALIVWAYLAALWSVLSAVPVEPFFVTDTWSQAASGRALINAERVMYDQRDQVERALQSLTPQRPGVSDLYFVAFAGDASQAVFRREVAFVRDLFERDFDARGRAVSLVNSDQTTDHSPIASSTNLAEVLAGIGAQMDPERDLLFLFLTSHGSPPLESAPESAVELAVEFAPIPLRPIAPGDLREMLDQAGIRWRVIVISACFSGGFIETLENDETLLVTASAVDRESFGCSHEADFTYFGRAYFERALARTRSFEAAFEAARDGIDRLERSEGKEPSLPQISMGEKIRPLLRDFEQRLVVGSGRVRASDQR